jgi:enoyl-CoA hydratase
MTATFAALTKATKLSSLEECIAAEYRYVYRALVGHDLYEGVRALLVDKDRNPQWQFATIADVPDAIVEAHFAPLGDDEWQAR